MFGLSNRELVHIMDLFGQDPFGKSEPEPWGVAARQWKGRQMFAPLHV